MPTRRSPRHAPLSRVLYYFHPLQCPYDTITLFSSHALPPAHFPLLLLRYWLSRAKLCYFSANHDSRARTARHSDGPRRYKLASMKFNTFARWSFLRLPRSCRVAEKSDPIGSREPYCAVFQQITTVVHAQLDTPMGPDAINSQA